MIAHVSRRRLQNPLAQKILAGEVGAGDQVLVQYRGGKFEFEKAGAKRGTVAR